MEAGKPHASATTAQWVKHTHSDSSAENRVWLNFWHTESVQLVLESQIQFQPNQFIWIIWFNESVKKIVITRLYFFEEINTFIQQGWIKLINSDSKDIYNVIKDFYFN